MDTYEATVFRTIDEIGEVLSTRRSLRAARRKLVTEALARVEALRRGEADDGELAWDLFVMASLRAVGRAIVSWTRGSVGVPPLPADSSTQEEEVALIDALIQTIDSAQLDAFVRSPTLRTEQVSLLNRILGLHERRRRCRADRARVAAVACAVNTAAS